MNTPNPLMPQGSLQPSKGKSNVRFAFFTILAIHVVLLCGLLMQGCKRNPPPAEEVELAPTNAVTDFDPMITNNGLDSSSSGLPVDPMEIPPSSLPPVGDVAATTSAVPPSVGTPGGLIAPGGTSAVSTAPIPPVTAPVVPDVSAPVAGEGQVHVVQKGEMLSTIARKYGVSVRALEEANPNVNPLRLQIGQKLNVPAGAAPAAAPAVTDTATADAGGATIYTVKSGDALEKIARQHGTTVKAIKALNGLKTDRINVGQKLKIPAASNGTTTP